MTALDTSRVSRAIRLCSLRLDQADSRSLLEHAARHHFPLDGNFQPMAYGSVALPISSFPSRIAADADFSGRNP